MMIGRVLSERYLITEMVGKGGMATVYRGVDQKLGRTVAIKVIHPGISADPKFAQHFITEGRNAAALNHPNIVGVYDIGEDGSNQYIVLEFVQGKTLKQLLTDGPLPLDRALDYGRQVALGLAAAHERGILHLDVKPQNILVTDGGVAKLADFGISRAGAATGLVTTAMIVGTLDYLAPEQIEGKKSDQRTDIYALGLVIYEMLAGTLPFEQAQSTAQALAQRIVTDPKPLTHARPHIPSDVEAVVMRALYRNPSARYATATMLADALVHRDIPDSQPIDSLTLREGPTIVVPVPRSARSASVSKAQNSPRPWWKRRMAMPTIAVAGLLMVGIAAGFAMSWTGNVPSFSAGMPPRLDGAPPDSRNAIGQFGEATVAALSPSKATTTTTAAPAPTMTPTIASIPTAASASTPVSANTPRTPPTAAPSETAQTKPQPTTVEPAATPSPAIPATPESQPLASADAPVRTLTAHSCAVMTVAFAPNGSILASGGCPYDKTVRLWRTSDGTLLHTLTEHTNRLSRVRFSPDGQLLVSSSGDWSVGIWRVSDWSMVRRLTGFSKYLEDVAFSPNGQFLVTAIPDNPVLFFRVSDWQTFQTASVPEGAQSLAVSPDGQLLAVGGAVGGPVRLYRFSDGTFLRTLPGNVGTALRMSFSPDGQILASTSRSAVNLWRIGDGELSRILEGEASPNKRTYSPQDIRDIAFSPDGKTLAAGSSAGKIFLWRLGDGELTRTFSASTGAILSLAFAPSGKLLASGDASGVIKLWQMP